MKKWMFLLLMLTAGISTNVWAQPPGGGQQMTPEQRNAMMKERFKGMGCDDVQADSLIAISNDMRPRRYKNRGMYFR
jgi:hypothetical protein